MFFCDTNEQLHAMSRIKRIGPARKHPKGWADLFTVWMDDDSTVEIQSPQMKALSRTMGGTFAAQPGCYLLDRIEGDVPSVHKTLIIAWAIGLFGAVHPITVHGVETDEDDQAILHPDGTVCVPNVGDFATVEAYLAGN